MYEKICRYFDKIESDKNNQIIKDREMIILKNFEFLF